jgi:hypothetical protein
MKDLNQSFNKALYFLVLAGFMPVMIPADSIAAPNLKVTEKIANNLSLKSLTRQSNADPVSVSVAASKEVSMIGEWPNISGDKDMDTDAGDYVPVRCSTNIYIEGNKLILKVFYRIEEYGGDHTIYSGARTTVLYENKNPDYSIRTVELEGSRLNNFFVYSDGRNYEFRDFHTSGTYWDYLQYRIDGPGDDKDVVGIRGSLKFNVILQVQPAVTVSKATDDI